MTKIIVFNSVTLDGVVQAPGRPDEDRRGGFKHGGWSVPYADEETGKLAAEGMQTTGAMLLGRAGARRHSAIRTWPHDTPQRVVSPYPPRHRPCRSNTRAFARGRNALMIS